MAEACTIRAAFFPRFTQRRTIEKKLQKVTVIVGSDFPRTRLQDFIDAVYPKASVEFMYHDDPRLERAQYEQCTYDARQAGHPAKMVMIPRAKNFIYGERVVHLNFFDVRGGQIFWWSWTPEENDTVKREGIR